MQPATRGPPASHCGFELAPGCLSGFVSFFFCVLSHYMNEHFWLLIALQVNAMHSVFHPHFLHIHMFCTSFPVCYLLLQ